MTKKFIIYSGGFDENSGGSIVLHRLCDLLNRVGQEAYMWPVFKRLPGKGQPIQNAFKAIKFRHRINNGRFSVFPGFETPLAELKDLEDAIAVYPEIVDGNPLRAKHVVRWLLHKPGFHTGRVNFGPDDRFFFFQHAFNDRELNTDEDNLLKTVFIRDDIYQQTYFGERQGTCHILRKGQGRPLVHDASQSLLVDGMSHQQMAEVFNRSQVCISYDLYTMYSYYAALCGCTSIVVPEPGMSKEQWYPDEGDRYGIAYGWDDLAEAQRTKPLLLPHLKAQERAANASVLAFVARCNDYFGSH